jgi:hypothetical protein
LDNLCSDIVEVKNAMSEATEAINMRLPWRMKERFREEAFKRRTTQQDLVIEALKVLFMSWDQEKLERVS